MKIHLHSKAGLYEVERFGRNSIMLSTKHNSFSVPTSDFKSFAGGLWNNQVTKDEMDQFLSVVRPEEYKVQVAQEDQILTLAARMDRIQAEVNALPIEEIVNAIDTRQHEEDEHIAALNSYQQEINDDNEEYAMYMKDIEDAEAKRTPEEWNTRLAKKSTEIDELNAKMKNIASRVYSQNLDFSKLQLRNGIKFIIQQDRFNDNLMRFSWDPYGFVPNAHRDISEIYREGDYYTVNGGWIKIIGNDVILYAQSGDYGVFDDTIAVLCAKKVFPGKQIHPFAGQEWDEIANKFDDLPF
ncbi:MAG: hypothetical protein WCK31_04045 [bacterium]